MSEFLNRQAAECLELAARSHRRAADFHQLGDAEGCLTHAEEGHDLANVALRASLEARQMSSHIVATSMLKD
jgi:hypothetical protein